MTTVSLPSIGARVSAATMLATGGAGDDKRLAGRILNHAAARHESRTRSRRRAHDDPAGLPRGYFTEYVIVTFVELPALSTAVTVNLALSAFFDVSIAEPDATVPAHDVSPESASLQL